MKRFLTVLFVVCFMFIFAAGSLDANSIPRIGGRWNLNGTGYVKGQRFTMKGTAVVTTFIDRDGYEVVTELLRQGDVYDSSGRYDTSFRNVNTGYYKITAKSFIIAEGGNSAEFFIESGTRITEKDKGYVQGYYVEENYIYTRGGADSSGGGGGCTAGASTPFAFLLVLPLFILAFRKCW